MTSILTGPFLHPQGAKNLLIMLHGYGASGDDLFPLVRNWAHDDLAIWTPNAPISTGYNGWCWFQFENLERRDIERSMGLHTTTEPTYQAIIEHIQAHHFESVIIGGFSQGAMLALHIMALYQRLWPVLAYGGGFFTQNPPALEGSEVCLIHGAEDDVVAPSYLTESMLTLAKLGASVEGHIRPYVGHSIDLIGARIGKSFVDRQMEKRKSS